MTAETRTAPDIAAPDIATADPEHADRIAALRLAMRTEDLAAMVIAAPENVYYLTGLDHLGYFAPTLLVLPLAGRPLLITRAMERPTVAAQVPWCEHACFTEGADPAEIAVAALRSVVPPGSRVAVEDASMFLPARIVAGIRAALPGLRWRSGSALLADQRAAKSPAEQALTRRAAAVSDAAMSAALAAARPGVRDRDIAAATYQVMFTAGGDTPGFPPLIRPTSLLDREHVTWRDRRFAAGQGLFLEMSGCVDRYHAPLSRTVYLGQAPPEAADAAEAALAGLTAAWRALRPGVPTGEVYLAWQRAAAGTRGGALPQRHHCGYLVGIGFPPSWVGGPEVMGIRAGGRTEIREGMVFHLMSWVTDPIGHVVSDTALVTATGCELLTATPRELTVLPAEGARPCASPA